MPLSNHIIVASAGSGKTTTIVDYACGDASKQSAIITYTKNGREEITSKSYQRFGCIPPHVNINTWFAFLLRHFVRPYQRCLYDLRVAGIHFISNRSALRIPENNTRAHYFSKRDLIYSDKISKFACKVIEKTDGLPLRRFEQIYDELFIDESQDLAGYDLDLVELLLQSSVKILLVGDHRQATYATHSAAKNSKYAGANIILKFEEWEKIGLCSIDYQNYSHRCIQEICDFADQFYPGAHNTVAKNTEVTGHDGVFAVQKCDVTAYMAAYAPQPLRYDRKTKHILGKPINYGAAKGKTFERTLIYPHGPLKKFLQTGKIEDAGKEIAKIYVAITRARQSVAFVVDDKSLVSGLTIYRP